MRRAGFSVHSWGAWAALLFLALATACGPASPPASQEAPPAAAPRETPVVTDTAVPEVTGTEDPAPETAAETAAETAPAAPARLSPTPAPAPARPSPTPTTTPAPTATPAPAPAPSPAPTPTAPVETTPTPSTAPSPAPRVWTARVTYAEAPATAWRDGRSLDLNPGQAVEPYDLLSTGAGGAVEVSLSAPGLSGVTLRMSEKSQFYFDPAVLDAAGTTVVQHLSGTLALKVQRLSGSAGLEVHTRSAVLGVRGTEFKVIEAPTQDLLVTVREGRVALGQDSSARTLDPGAAAVASPGSAPEVFPGRVDQLDARERRWFDTIMADLEPLTRPRLEAAARTWDTRVAQFEEAWRGVQQNLGTLNQWKADKDAGRPGNAADRIRRQQLFGPLMLQLRRNLVFLERDAAWFTSLEGVLPPGLANRDLPGNRRGSALIAQGRDRALQAKLSQARRVLALYRDLNEGSPLADFFNDPGLGF